MSRHLELYRYPNQPPAHWPAPKKGVILYALVNPSKTYKPNGKRECERRMRQLAKIEARIFRYWSAA